MGFEIRTGQMCKINAKLVLKRGEITAFCVVCQDVRISNVSSWLLFKTDK